MIRLFVDTLLAEGGVVAPSADQSRYLTQVMRRAAGDEILVFNGADGEWRAALTDVGKRGCKLALVARARPQTATPDLELVVALVKRTRLETIVEKAAELGVRRIRLAITQHTNADHTRVERLQAIAIEAAEQTGRMDVPAVEAPLKLDALLKTWDETRRLLFCDEGGEAKPVIEALHGMPRQAWAVLIGPEGGFSSEERARLRGLPFVTAATLGPRILRADTAAISALTLWQAALGDWTP